MSVLGQKRKSKGKGKEKNMNRKTEKSKNERNIQKKLIGKSVKGNKLSRGDSAQQRYI